MLGAGRADGADEHHGGVAADDGVVDDEDGESLHGVVDGVVLDADGLLPQLLRGHDERACDVAILGEALDVPLAQRGRDRQRRVA